MTTSPLLVPALDLPAHVGRSAARSRRCDPLPLARSAVSARLGSAVYALVRVDNRGRLADGATMAALGWHPGDPVAIRIADAVITVARDPGGALAVSRQGRVHLPTGIRLACGINVGDRVLLAADPGRAVLTVHPLAVVDAMLSLLHTQPKAGATA